MRTACVSNRQSGAPRCSPTLTTATTKKLSDDKGAEILNTLFDHQEQRTFVYEHVWRPNDVLLWDNRCTLHARTDFSDKERRLMRRVAIKGEKPV
jgi:taurine dioxygenase